MRLAGRDKRILDADMDLDAVAAKPHPAPGREHRRFGDLGDAQDAGVERTRGGLAPGGHDT
jgi:hypothetical protein